MKNLLLLIGLLSGGVRAGEAQLELTIDGLKHGNGKLIVMLFDDQDSFPTQYDEAVKTQVVNLDGRTQVEMTFDQLATGHYAIRVHHDEDGNGKLKKRFFRPKEGLGFSNNYKMTLLPPNFDDARFTLVKGDTQVSINTITYFD